LRGVTEAEAHYRKLEKTERYRHSSFVNIAGGNRNLMVGTDQVKLNKDRLSREVRRKIVQVGKRVSVWNGDAVQLAVITARSERPVFLGHQQERAM